jgi:diguanylate cyclase (GGDEF)-like protein
MMETLILRMRPYLRAVTVLNVYIAAVIAAGTTVVVGSAAAGTASIGDSYAEFWILAGLVALGEFLPVKTSDGHGEITTSTIFTFALLLRFGTFPAVVAQSIASILADLATQKRAWKVAFNVSQYAIALAGSGAILGLVSGADPFAPLPGFDRASFPAILSAGAAFFLLNSWLPRIGMALQERIPIWRALIDDFVYQASLNGILLTLSPIVVMVGEKDFVYIPLLAVPMAIVYKSATVHAERDYKAYLALHDPLTGLPNRALFYDRVKQSISEAGRRGTELAVLLIDLDRFKEINDSLGHHAGDLLLQRVGPRIKSVLRESDTVARLGGDEFAVLLPDVDGADHASLIAKRIDEALDEPFVLEDLPEELTLDVEGSIGIALFPQQGGDVETLIQRADVAMYLAKEAHTGHEVYAYERDRHSAGQLAMLGELRRGLDNGELILHFQPKQTMDSRDISCVEALLRWQSERRGLVLPGEFIPPAERTGLIHRITKTVIDQALAQVREWQDDGIDLRVAVNLARRNLLDLRLPGVVQELLTRWGIDPDLLEFEITESSIMADPARAAHVLTQLSSIGVKLALDDFGVGYSSLSYLTRLPVNEIKIDKSFVMNMSHDDNDRVIVRSTIELAHNLGLTVVAEGVEDEPTWRDLLHFGCDVAQGFHIGRPGTAQEILGALEIRTARSAG